MRELQGQLKRLRQNNVNIGFMPGLINLGRLKKQQNLVERSCTEETLTKDPGFIQAEERLSAEIFCRGRREETKNGLRVNQNILLNILVQRARPKEVEITQRREPKPMHIKLTWSASFSRKKSCCIKVTLLYDF
ncbi:hypothetical protein V6N12_003483 [Hibiscus sabdariffa]|uniref:Uncharacterized protein n=1 Tax=Hibiscus sabdariffa TaxID=183260 RepID=A0ABR2AMP6_9ROSI